MLKSIKAFFAGLLVKVKSLLAKHIPLAEKLLQDFTGSEAGKKFLEELKSAQDKEAKILEALNCLKDQALALAQNDPILSQKILDYLKKKILAGL